MTSFPIYPSDSIDFTSLIFALSTSNSTPSSIKVRNRLLSPWTVPSLPSFSDPQSNSGSELTHSILSQVQADSDPWSSFKKFQPGVEVFVFGEPPTEVIQDGKTRACSGKSEVNGSKLWAVLVFAPTLPMPDRTGGPRIDFWISSQAILRPMSKPAIPGPQHQHLLEAESQVLLFIMKDWLPGKLKDPTFVLCGIEQRLCDLVTSWTLQGQELSNLEVEWSGSYVSYIKESSLKDIDDMIAGDIKRKEEKVAQVVEGRWKVEKIGDGDLNLVQSTNKIPFPMEYVRGHLSHSVLLRDTQESQVEGQEKGKASGWVYNHDDLALASLHVAQPYRRMHATSPQGQGKGIGTLLMNLMAPRVGLVQLYALKKSGNSKLLERNRDGTFKCGEILTPCVATTELGNSAARSLFSKCGYSESDKVAWMGLRVKE